MKAGHDIEISVQGNSPAIKGENHLFASSLINNQPLFMTSDP